MRDLRFRVVGAEPVEHAASPLLALRLRVESGADVQSILLRCQVRIEPNRRRYTDEETRALRELFGEPSRWVDTLKSMLLANVAVVVPGFRGSTETDLPLPCSLDLSAAASKYFHAVGTGDIPLLLLFSGTVFYADPLRAEPIAWTEEATYLLPASVWRAAVEHYFPGVAPVTLRREVFERLAAYRRERSLPSMDEAIERLLDDGAGRGSEVAASAPAAPIKAIKKEAS